MDEKRILSFKLDRMNLDSIAWNYGNRNKGTGFSIIENYASLDEKNLKKDP